MDPERPRIVGMAWYDRETYGALRARMLDGHRMAETFEGWQLSAEQVEAEVARSGVTVRRVHIEFEPFSAWCEEKGLSPDGAARSAYVNARTADG